MANWNISMKKRIKEGVKDAEKKKIEKSPSRCFLRGYRSRALVLQTPRVTTTGGPESHGVTALYGSLRRVRGSLGPESRVLLAALLKRGNGCENRMLRLRLEYDWGLCLRKWWYHSEGSGRHDESLEGRC